MMEKRPDPMLHTDDAAIAQARSLLGLPHAALAFEDLEGAPGISRIALGLDPAGLPLTLISALAIHTAALRANPACALMMGEPGTKGDPLTHPRLMMKAVAGFVAQGTADHDRLRECWLSAHPKAKLYVDFADFTFVRLRPVSGLLNGGFGKAYRLSAQDLAAPREG